MKTKYVLQTLVLLLAMFTATAQQGINYKAIIHDDNGDPLANATITVQFTILENGTIEVYKESHNPTTDANGILIVNIGEGTPISGSFATIDWGSNSHFLKTEMDSGGGLTDMGMTEFQVVPYSLHAQIASGIPDYIDFANVENGDVLVYDGNLFKPAQFDFYYKDFDGDGYGTEQTYLYSPVQPPGHIGIPGDCDDNDSGIFPGAEELCDGLDNDCNGIPDFPGGEDDADEDGFRLCEGDCDDVNASIYPGATEICGDGIDQDCDGSDTPCEVFEIDTEDPLEAAASMGIIEGLVSAEWVLPDGSPMPSEYNFSLGHGVLSAFGPNVAPLQGLQMLALSTGTARAPTDPDYSEDQNRNYACSLPELFNGYPICPDPGGSQDGIGLKVVLTVPNNASGFNYSYKYYSKDYPEYVCTEYTDYAAAIIIPKSLGNHWGNIMFDYMGGPVCASSSNIITFCINQVGYSCIGITELLGTGFEGHGGSSWIQNIPVSVQAGTNIEIIFSIWDSGDGMMTSTILLDNWQWIYD
jgi:hypothetical protein